VLNDSNTNRLVAIDPKTGKDRASVDIPGDPPYARGLAPLGGNRWLVGSQRPLAVHEVDLEQGQLVDSYIFDAPVDETVFGVYLLPDEFSAPPQLQGQSSAAFWQRAILPAGATPIPT
jgi:hypothetical protein